MSSYFEKKEQKTKDQQIYENRKWCHDNDFKIFVKPLGFGTKQCKICVQRGGISTDGYESKEINGVIKTAKIVEGEITYKTQEDAFKAIPELEKKLRERYG